GSFDLSSLLGGSTGTSTESGQGESIENCETGADANEDDSCRLAAASLALDQYWTEQVDGYREPGFIIVDGATSTPCGTASNQTGPFYCPGDETVYIDPTFFGLLRQQFGASGGSLAQLYVLAHEWGHHIQSISGIMQEYPNNGTGPTSNGVRTELQADCFAGAWVAGMTQQVDENGVPFMQAPTPQQISDALNAAASVGDDHIQQESGGQVNPESWTHGSSQQRQRWFDAGLEGGVGACDTFAVSGRDL
ncbi:MAG: neutral zinc metallopeptidase, partial [Microbacterium sp.]